MEKLFLAIHIEIIFDSVADTDPLFNIIKALLPGG